MFEGGGAVAVGRHNSMDGEKTTGGRFSMGTFFG